MVAEFAIDYRLNEDFDSLVALNFAFEGSGAALMAAAALLNYSRGVLAGLVLVLFGILFLILHLGNRLRSWRAVLGLGNAWISRGVIFAAGLVCFGVYFLFAPAGPVAAIGTVVCGLLTALYSGFLLASMTSIPFWNSPFTPVLFLLHSLTTGFAILAFLLTRNADRGLGGRSTPILLALVSVTLISTVIHMAVMMRATNAARQSANVLLHGALRWCFLAGAMVVGLVAPLLIAWWIVVADAQPVPSATAALLAVIVLRIIGDVMFRYSVLKAGVFEVLL